MVDILKLALMYAEGEFFTLVDVFSKEILKTFFFWLVMERILCRYSYVPIYFEKHTCFDVIIRGYENFPQKPLFNRKINRKSNPWLLLLCRLDYFFRPIKIQITGIIQLQ